MNGAKYYIMELSVMGMRPTYLHVGPLFMALAICSSSVCYSQVAAPAIELKQNPLAALKAFEPDADQEYELGSGDEITVEVVGRPELSGKNIVGPDGRITLPVVGSVLLKDKTRTQAAADIQKALSEYYSGITVSVGVDKYTANEITLLGAVERPGVLSFNGTPTLLEVISKGGLPTQPTKGSGETNSPPTSGGGLSSRPLVVPEECMIYRGDKTMVTVQLRTLLKEGNPLADMRLRRGDIVYVPGQEKYVSVLGQVLHPGTVKLDNQSTLPQLLADVGGPTDKAGRYPNIQIVHRGTDNVPGKVQVISYKDVLLPKPLDLTLLPGDIIYVPESGLSRASFAIQTISPLVNLITVGALLK